MKKVLFALAFLAVAAAAFTGCKKEEKQDDKVVKRVTMCGDKWDKYYVTYNENGTISAVQRNFDEEKNYWEKEWLFTWDGKNATAEYKEKGVKKGDRDCVFTFGDNGYLSSYASHWGDTWGFTYDKDGHVTKIVRVDKDNAVKANCVWEKGNLVKWSRFVEKTNAETGEKYMAEEWKLQTFTAEENIAGIFPDATDKADVNRWMFEVGYCGKASKNLLDEAVWEGAKDSAVQTYEKDDDGFVTVVSKVYGTDEPELYYYEWEKIKK